MSRAWTLASRPKGFPTLENFTLKDIPDRPLNDGEIRVKNNFFSVDPYMRPRMDEGDSYIAPFGLNEPMTGAAVGQVIETRSDRFKVGDRVSHFLGWRDVATLKAENALPLPDRDLKDEYFLDVLGTIGMTAYFGLFDVAEARPGDVVFVSAAAGAVGSLVVQIAKLRGMTVIGSAGGAEKCEFVRSLGADYTIDYKSPGQFEEKLRKVAPDGVDVYFDNVGGEQLNAAIGVAKRNARFAICGMIAMYNSDEPNGFSNLSKVISKRLSIRGFINTDFMTRRTECLAQMGYWVSKGMIKSRYTIFDGLEKGPEAFFSLFSGGNTGKALVRLGS
ncbi:NADP-dependent oxidoreductase [Zymomonas mobilis]|uniref:Zinc-binding alcohol dehydrogenase n=1 Tax=Zymomonas mobilis subsp. pomaceae (strain ATCC 29192 / DSM 22645 / JCM 10191 / CCUG 17912 / NBRC 13757 / NCIMB 11200 / NRRL B-4491 / Barker I) TaxID=579138 RepID=F8EWJ1_ZYMMT|nr:NADP-dependent oxidoreductase [Zymomonas mobilis]AEI38634.1 zinc-binding alcohol dehydrogenase [Zymomonas mobilis subsp. pomaceae ATCC 29192]MDX5947825.1 NADP-dependent oxidoreductase [Zymomonas mobilis subsp. pomaceae]GEB90075.1 NADP-dependent oxidoreductase [Zymomonas mobilis subsp. pomaceae]